MLVGLTTGGWAGLLGETASGYMDGQGGGAARGARLQIHGVVLSIGFSVALKGDFPLSCCKETQNKSLQHVNLLGQVQGSWINLQGRKQLGPGILLYSLYAWPVTEVFGRVTVSDLAQMYRARMLCNSVLWFQFCGTPTQLKWERHLLPTKLQALGEDFKKKLKISRHLKQAFLILWLVLTDLIFWNPLCIA